MHLLKEGYQRTYGKDLGAVIRGELSMKTERYVRVYSWSPGVDADSRVRVRRMFVMALAGTRDENPNVNPAAVQQDIQALHNAGTGRLGTVSFAILASRIGFVER